MNAASACRSLVSRWFSRTIALVIALALAGGVSIVPADARQGGFRLEEATLPEVRAAFASGELTCQGLVGMYLDRMEAYDDRGPSLNAVLQTNPDAMAEAAALDERYASSGPVGPLHCAPLLLKDNYDTGDMPTTASSVSLEGSRPPDDATTVKKLKDAGALVVGKTNLHEFALSGETRSSLGGQTLNPYDLTRTPGGSSGGTGAGLAANFGLLGTGTDTVNSIRSPSSANSLVGIRGTAGLVSRDGIVPVSSTQDSAGPLARTVEDAAAMLEVMAGPDPADPITSESEGRIPSSYTSSLDEGGLQGARIGVLENFFGEDPALHGEVNEVTEAAILEMEAAGAETLDIRVPGVDTDTLVEELDVQRYEYESLMNEYLGGFSASKPSLDEIVDSGEYDDSIAEFLEDASGVDNGLDSPEYRERLRKGDELREQVLQVMDENNLDVLVYPHQKRLVAPVGGSQEDRSGILAAATGLPAITLPGGFSSPTEAAPVGVPVGVEFIGRPWSEGDLIGYGYAFEQATGFRQPPESAPPLSSEAAGTIEVPETGGPGVVAPALAFGAALLMAILAVGTLSMTGRISRRG